MATIDKLTRQHELLRDEDGKMWVRVKHKCGSSTYRPIAFDNLADYQKWLKTNRRRLTREKFLPDDERIWQMFYDAMSEAITKSKKGN